MRRNRKQRRLDSRFRGNDDNGGLDSCFRRNDEVGRRNGNRVFSISAQGVAVLGVGLTQPEAARLAVADELYTITAAVQAFNTILTHVKGDIIIGEQARDGIVALLQGLGDRLEALYQRA